IVDNVLVRVGDPTFLGYFIEKGVSSVAKVVRKAYPQENVGVFVERGRGGPLSVVEYSEMDVAMTTEINQSTGRLRVCWSNIFLHTFSLEFLNQVANNLEKDSVYHLAQKTIPSFHGYTTGLKLERFIFDAFKYSPSTTLFEVLREEEFAPVKNANGSAYDTPHSAKLMLLRLHNRWVVAAGCFRTHSVLLYMTCVEVSPLSYYTRENLEAICRGQTFHARIVLHVNPAQSKLRQRSRPARRVVTRTDEQADPHPHPHAHSRASQHKLDYVSVELEE
ncbi:UDP-N-acetylglucosamine diphosphorylase 1-like, partial [Hordeum vulgare subsp. vulgare]|uniref:UDP-N-acetylglucosamine diphosphorylase 1-like n=1 Tax=Hordeum vulgare subsp. vulgare TaxID=112509 RepID=UPI001D1A40FD